MKRTMLCVLALVMAAVSAPAVAQYHGDDSDDPVSGELSGALRFHVDTSIFRYASTTNTQSVGDVSMESTSNAMSFGTPAGLVSGLGNLSLGVGYAVTDSIVIGSAFQVGYDSIADPDDDNSTVSFLSLGAAPYFEYLGGASSTKPFIGATVYVRHAAFSTPSFDEPGSDDTMSDTILGGGLIGGAHFFVADACSIDLTGKLTYGVGSGPDAGPMVDTSLTVLDFSVNLGVSAWIL